MRRLALGLAYAGMVAGSYALLAEASSPAVRGAGGFAIAAGWIVFARALGRARRAVLQPGASLDAGVARR